MEKVGVSKLIDFGRKKTQGSKLTFVNNLKKPKAENTDGGGDYWITSTSACAATFWNQDKSYLDHKIEELKEKIKATDYKQTKDQFQQNVNILLAMQDFDFTSIIPPVELVKQSLKENIININNLPVQVRPQHIFSYKIDEEENIGGVWFVAKKGGYSQGELGMFSAALHKNLTKRFSDKYVVNSQFCISIDISSVKSVSYSQIQDDKVPDLLNSTISDLRKLL